MMSKRQKSGCALSFAPALDRLAEWFERKQRVLPWRDEPTLYRVWISEIMLQQTQVVTVVPYFERFVARFPTVGTLAAAPVDDVLGLWAGLGYYSRARNLHKAAQQIVAMGGFPRDREGWLGIPGVGNYTAGAILSIALDRPEAILDGNVERVLSRVRKVARGRGDAAYKARLWRLSRAFVERAAGRGLRPRVINQALMELGATTCTPRKPLCVVCPLATICRAGAVGEAEAYPPRKKPKEWLQVREELDCVLDSSSGRVLLRQRGPGEWRAGLWDLPEASCGVAPGRAGEPGSGGLPEEGIFARRATSAEPWPGAERMGQVETRHVVTRHKITRVTHVWHVRQDENAALLKAAEAGGGSGLRWVSIAQPEVAVGSALAKTLQSVRERYSFSDRIAEKRRSAGAQLT